MSRRYIWLVSFTSGMCVMALEMTASRVVSPYFGTSLSVWANVIGLILLALTAGYWLGGRWAEASPKLSTLLKLLLASAVLAAAIPLLAAPIANTFIANAPALSGGTLIRLGSFVVIALLFVVPIGLLGTTSPFIIKLLATDTRVGETAGRVFALSTVGSIIGTFAPAFWLVPTFGTRATVLLFAGILFTVVLLGLGGVRLGVLGLAPLAAAAYFVGQPLKATRGLIADAESQYQYIQVVQKPDRSRVMLFDHGRSIQSLERPDTPFTGGYWDTLFPMPNLSPAEKPKVLILGFAGGSIARGILETRPEGAVEVTGVELDDRVLELARAHFSAGRLEPRMHLVAEDARVYYLARNTARWDLILLDVYANESYVPPHLVTREFFALAQSRLAPGGVLVCNVNAPKRDSLLLTSFFRTLQAVFPHVESVQKPGTWNRELLASDTPIDWAGAERRLPAGLQNVFMLTKQWRVPADATGGLLLTDDRAPVELLTDAQSFQASSH